LIKIYKKEELNMFKKILFPTDFSDVSKSALRYVKQLKEGGAETIVLLHVIDQRSIQAIDQFAGASSLELEREIMVQAEKEIEEIENELKQSGFKVKSLLETGYPTRTILDVEKKEDVSIIVIGSHGKSNLEEMFLGSVSEKVVRKCKKPVLIVKR
jgi:nucleotide-binding universal stress UspA family protein